MKHSGIQLIMAPYDMSTGLVCESWCTEAMYHDSWFANSTVFFSVQSKYTNLVRMVASHQLQQFLAIENCDVIKDCLLRYYSNIWAMTIHISSYCYIYVNVYIFIISLIW